MPIRITHSNDFYATLEERSGNTPLVQIYEVVSGEEPDICIGSFEIEQDFKFEQMRGVIEEKIAQFRQTMETDSIVNSGPYITPILRFPVDVILTQDKQYLQLVSMPAGMKKDVKLDKEYTKIMLDRDLAKLEKLFIEKMSSSDARIILGYIMERSEVSDLRDEIKDSMMDDIEELRSRVMRIGDLVYEASEKVEYLGSDFPSLAVDAITDWIEPE